MFETVLNNFQTQWLDARKRLLWQDVADAAGPSLLLIYCCVSEIKKTMILNQIFLVMWTNVFFNEKFIL